MFGSEKKSWISPPKNVTVKRLTYSADLWRPIVLTVIVRVTPGVRYSPRYLSRVDNP